MAGRAAFLPVVAVLLAAVAHLSRCSVVVVKHRLSVRIEDGALVSGADDHEPAPACRLAADAEVNHRPRRALSALLSLRG